MREVQKVDAVFSPPPLPTKKRVAAYARVSKGKEESLRSLSAQVSYYNAYIQKRPDWDYAGVYTDEALTGTKEERPAFQRLLQDCKDGKIDIIVTKSISRLARNTITTLETIRELKALNIDVWFERENIHSLSSEGELLITILASFAQEESYVTSENTKWRLRKRFEQGRTRDISMLGYEVVDEKFTIIPEEAEIVRFIFAEYLKGNTAREVKLKLEAAGYRSKTGRKIWNTGSIVQTLGNETYTGTLLLQRSFTVDHISKKVRKNRGEVPMYRVENNHEPIIDKDTFDKVQHLLAYNAKHRKPSQDHPLAGKVICSLCGNYYHRAIGRKGTPSETINWFCNTYVSKGKSTCPAEMIPERILLGFNFAYEKVTTYPQETLVFTLPDGTETTVKWQRRSRKEAFADRRRENEEKERGTTTCQQPLE